MQTKQGVPGDVFTASQALVIKTCPSCGVLYGMPQRLDDHANNQPSGDVTWYCPLGHSIVKTKSARDRLAEQLGREEARARSLADQLGAAEAHVEHERRRANGYKGVMTQTKKRASKGVCPVPGCHRHFADVERHVATKHPSWEAST